MSTTARSTNSPWSTSVSTLRTPRLNHDITCDVCIVGAGIAGLSVAYSLARAGLKVAVLDDGCIGCGQTQVTTAHLSNLPDHRYVSLERMHGTEGAKLAAASHTAAIERIGSIALEEGIACEFERLDGYLFLAPDDDIELLESEYDAARRANVPKVSWEQNAPLASFDTGRCLRFPGQGQFHPLKYLAGLARAILKRGSSIYCYTHANRIDGGPSTATIETPQGVVTSRAVVVATNTPVNNLVAVHTKQAPYLTYAIAARIAKGAAVRALYWDTANPFHYVRFQTVRKRPGIATAELLIVGGEDHRTGQADDGTEHFEQLEEWAHRRFPRMQRVKHRWAGQIMDSVDGLAYIGRNPGDSKNVYIVTGDSGNGLTHGTIAGMLITDLILDKPNPWSGIYDPGRVNMHATGKATKEALNTAAQYGTWITPGDIDALDDLQTGQGAILRHGLKKLAVYRDEEGHVVKLSAVCPHLLCIVAWNSAERTWDCPCHGSRFLPTGEVINGPANSSLEKIE